MVQIVFATIAILMLKVILGLLMQWSIAVPAIISIWDDAYGISVSNEIQMTKSDVSEVLAGFQRDKNNAGFEIIKVKGWDYPALMMLMKKQIS